VKLAPEVIEEVSSHIRAGMSYNEIAETVNKQFATSLTRNSISGIAYRKGLQSKAAPLKPKPRRAQQSRPHDGWFKPSPPEMKTPKPFVAVAEPEDVARISLAEMERRHCRWPVGDPRDPDFGYCGLPRVNPFEMSCPYCTIHSKRARASGARE